MHPGRSPPSPELPGSAPTARGRARLLRSGGERRSRRAVPSWKARAASDATISMATSARSPGSPRVSRQSQRASASLLLVLPYHRLAEACTGSPMDVPGIVSWAVSSKSPVLASDTGGPGSQSPGSEVPAPAGMRRANPPVRPGPNDQGSFGGKVSGLEEETEGEGGGDPVTALSTKIPLRRKRFSERAVPWPPGRKRGRKALPGRPSSPISRAKLGILFRRLSTS